MIKKSLYDSKTYDKKSKTDGYTLTVSSVVATAVESPNWVVSFKTGVG